MKKTTTEDVEGLGEWVEIARECIDWLPLLLLLKKLETAPTLSEKADASRPIVEFVVRRLLSVEPDTIPLFRIYCQQTAFLKAFPGFERSVREAFINPTSRG